MITTSYVYSFALWSTENWWCTSGDDNNNLNACPNCILRLVKSNKVEEVYHADTVKQSELPEEIFKNLEMVDAVAVVSCPKDGELDSQLCVFIYLCITEWSSCAFHLFETTLTLTFTIFRTITYNLISPPCLCLFKGKVKLTRKIPPQITVGGCGESQVCAAASINDYAVLCCSCRSVMWETWWSLV